MSPQYIKITANGTKRYFRDQMMKIRHREDGPAVEGASGLKLWYLNGIPLSEEEFLKQTNEIKNEQNCYY